MGHSAIRWPEPHPGPVVVPKGRNEYIVKERELKVVERFFAEKDHHKHPSPYGFKTTSSGNLSQYRETDCQRDLVACVASTSEPDEHANPNWDEKEFNRYYGGEERFIKPWPVYESPNVIQIPRSKKVFSPTVYQSVQEQQYYERHRDELRELAIQEVRAKWSPQTWQVFGLRRDGWTFTEIAEVTGFSLGRCHNIYEEAISETIEALIKAHARLAKRFRGHSPAMGLLYIGQPNSIVQR